MAELMAIAQVEIYSAPHLSTPCCLVEPIAIYSPNDLPVPYRKQYDDASQIVEQLKQRIPKVWQYLRFFRLLTFPYNIYYS